MTITGSFFHKFLVMLGVLAISACASTTPPVATQTSGWKLQDVSVKYGDGISRTATGNEFSSNFVWNGDGEGNRKKQVLSMFRVAMAEVGQTSFTGTQPVNMDVTINYFHALTNWSRLFCCGEHRIFADIAIKDAASGDVLASGENVSLGRLALGGVPGLIAVAAGRDQRVRITEGIAKRTRAWLNGD